MKPSGRFLRKCSASSGDWEDVGDDIAREKTSQVLRDAIQTRKSFSDDGEKSTLTNVNVHVKQRRKYTPCKMKNTLLQKSSQSSHRCICTKEKNNESYLHPMYGATSNLYSPDYTTFHRQYDSYGRISTSDPRNLREDVPHNSITSIPYQYQVTPSSSNIALTTRRKRPRYFQESPLVQGYHQYPYPTPIRSATANGTPPSSMAFTTPSNTKSRGLTFSPPSSVQKRSFANGTLLSPRSNTTFLTTEKDYPAHEMVHLPPDPSQKSKLSTQSYNQDFDFLLTDDVLSDSDNKQNSTCLFTSEVQEDLRF